ncbi:hypothetical protein COL922a_002008 [Colletotrichum nupharicola]|nr:hypothetical protein COL922a_002008 [Colletotrichum nupharicola]
MTQDEKIYRDPKSFNPDRYKPPSAGGHDNSVWIAAATMLATLNIGKKVGRDGQVIEPEVVFTNGGTW